MSKECRDVFFAKILRVLTVVKENKSFNPINIALLRADAVMFAPDDMSDLIQKPRFRNFRGIDLL